MPGSLLVLLALEEVRALLLLEGLLGNCSAWENLFFSLEEEEECLLVVLLVMFYTVSSYSVIWSNLNIEGDRFL